MKQITISTAFIAAAVSSNVNSFGLYQIVLIANDGTAFTACANSVNVPERGATVEVPLTLTEVDGNIKKDYNFSALGYEIPEQIENAPVEVVAEVWK